MRLVRLLLIYLVAVFVGGALLAPGFYFLAQDSASRFNFPGLAKIPFHRFVDRALLGLALVGLWPLLKTCGLLSWRQLGYVKKKDWAQDLGRGFLLGFSSLLVVFALAVLCGGRNVRVSPPWLGPVCGAVAAAAFVALLEETLFRGALFGILRQAAGWPKAMAASAVFYAAAHFLQKQDLPGPVTWLSGFEVVGRMLRPFAELRGGAVPMFFNLTLAGCILALAYQRTGALYLSIGLHAGWVFWLKMFRSMTEANPGAPAWLWGTDQMLDGWMALPILGATLYVTVRMFPAQKDVR